MQNLNVELPSNKKIGLFFALLSAIVSVYSYMTNSLILAFVFAAFASLLLSVSFIRPDILLPFNIAWMKFGLYIGLIVSPIVLGIIYFLVFTPTAILMRIANRDILHLKLNGKVSHWKSRNEENNAGSFKNQF